MVQSQKSAIKKFDFSPIGEKIKLARMEKKMTREELAEELSVSVGHITNIENKGKTPGFQLFCKLVIYFNISVDEHFFPSKNQEKGIKLQIFNLVEECDNTDLYVVKSVIQGIQNRKKQTKE